MGYDEILARAEITQKIHEYVASLRKEDGDLITLKYFLGYSDGEISKIPGISNSNVRVRVFRAKKKLAEQLLSEKEDYIIVINFRT